MTYEIVVVVVVIAVVVVVWWLFSSSPQACWPIDPFTPPPLLGGLWAELQKRVDRADQSVLIFPGWC